jgi:two-component system, OmpR family, sensor histidine kinase PrrB
MSLRLRVALFTALGTTALMVTGVVVVLNVFRTDQIATLDQVLETQHDLLRAPVLRAIRLDRPLAESLAAERLLSSATAIRVWDDDSALFEAGASEFLQLPPAQRGHTTMVGEQGDYRVLSDTVSSSREGPVTMEVAISMEEADMIYGLLRQRLRRMVVIGAVLFGLAGWVAAAGALAPLARLRNRAEGIAGTEDLRADFGRTDGPREVVDLAEAFEAMLARLRQAGLEKEETLDSARVFAAAAAHELRTPLTSIGANLELLRAHPETTDRADVLEDLVSEHHRIVGLLDSLRALSRGDLTGPDVFETVDLADIVDRSVAGARQTFPETAIELLAPEDPVMVDGWPEGLRLMIDNLLGNAATHGRAQAVPDVITVGLVTGREGVVLSVADRGPGIEPSERDHVVSRFTRGTSARGAGSGLGLALVEQQARIHGGSLSFSDTPGGGATVTIRLPSSHSHDPHMDSTD